MRLLVNLRFLLLPLLLGSCSSSRLYDADQILPPGEHVIRSVIDSDVLIPDGSSLHVDYLAGNRIFVQSGGTLTGLGKGSKHSTIYVESGALVPPLKRAGLVRVVPVDDAEDTFNTRFQKLLPAGTGSQTNPGHVTGSVLFGGGYYGHRYHRHRHGYHRSPSSRSVTVRPDTVRSRN